MARKGELETLQQEVSQLKAKLIAARDALKREPLPWGIQADRTYTREEFMAILGISEPTWYRMRKKGLPYTRDGGISGRLYQSWSEALLMFSRGGEDERDLPKVQP